MKKNILHELGERVSQSRQFQDLPSPNSPLMIASCRSGTNLAKKVVDLIIKQNIQKINGEETIFLKDVDFQFSDGETCVRLEKDVNGRDVFLFQALKDPTSNRNVDENYLAFLIAVRALREWGAKRITGVLPYLAYTRQDKPTTGKREPVTAELMANLSIEAGIDRLIVWAPHDRRVQGYYGKVSVNAISPLPFFLDQFQKLKNQNDCIGIAPDAGAADLMIAFCRNLGIRCAITSKHRPKPEQADVTEVIGDFVGMKRAVILDDMINTGGTVKAAITKVINETDIEEVWLGVSHFLGSSKAIDTLQNLHSNYGLKGVYVTDSVPVGPDFAKLDFTRVFSIDKPLFEIIKNIHLNKHLNKVLDEPNPILTIKD